MRSRMAAGWPPALAEPERVASGIGVLKPGQGHFRSEPDRDVAGCLPSEETSRTADVQSLRRQEASRVRQDHRLVAARPTHEGPGKDRASELSTDDQVG